LGKRKKRGAKGQGRFRPPTEAREGKKSGRRKYPAGNVRRGGIGGGNRKKFNLQVIIGGGLEGARRGKVFSRGTREKERGG